METAQEGNFVQKMETVDKNISDIKEKLTHLKSLENDIVLSLQRLKSEEEEYLERKEKGKKEQFQLKNEDPEVEYRRRLIERFTYKNTEMIQRIYSENQARAKQAHASLCHLNYRGEDLKLPLYNQPSELKIYNENVEKFKTFKPKLIKFLQMKRKGEIKVETHLKKKYENQKKMWLKRIERIDGNMKRRQRMNRARQFYEKEFPEIKKQREQQERFDRLGSRSIRSEAEFEEIANNLKEFEASQQHKKSLAVDAPKLLSTYDRRLRYINTNGRIRDLERFEKERKLTIIWTEDEKRIFREKFSQAPKDFEKISAALENKSCSDCVLFYYQNKKKEAFRSSKTKKKKTKAIGKGSIKADQHKGKNQNVMSSKITEFNFDVGEYSYIDEDEEDDEDGETGVDGNNDNIEPLLLEEENSQQAGIGINERDGDEVNNDAQSNPSNMMEETGGNEESSGEMNTDPQNKLLKTPSKISNKPPHKVFLTRSKINKSNSSDNKKTDTETESAASNSEPDQTQSEESGSESSYPPLRMTIIVTSPSNVKEKTAPAAPVASVISETVTQTSYFGETPPTQNIVSTVIPVEPSSEDLIRQHLNKMPEVNDPSRWSESEMIKAVDGLKKYGRSWVNIAKLVETKTENQCKNFYFNYKKKFNLEKILGISKKEEKEEPKEPVSTKLNDSADNKSEGTEDIKKKHETEKQLKQDGKGGKQETPLRTTRTRSGKVKSGKNTNISTETTKAVTATTVTTVTVASSTSGTNISISGSNSHKPTVISTTLASITTIGDSSTIEGTFAGARKQVVETDRGSKEKDAIEIASNESKVLPPPLLSQVDGKVKEATSPPPHHQQPPQPTSVDNKVEPFSPIRGISLREDLSRYERNIESLDEKKYLKSPMTQGEMPNFPTKATVSASGLTTGIQGDYSRQVSGHSDIHVAGKVEKILPKSRYDPLSAYQSSPRLDRPVGPRVERPMRYNEEETFSSSSTKFARHPNLARQRMSYNAMTRFPSSSSSPNLSQPYPSIVPVRHRSVEMVPSIRSRSPTPGVIKGPSSESLKLDELPSKQSIAKGQVISHQEEEKLKLFAQKFHENETMSAEMVEELVKSYFDNRPLRELTPPSQEEHTQYLRNLPRQAQSRSEVMQRAASIPDLRTPPHGADHRGERPPYAHAKREKRPYQTFDGEILLSKIPLTPLSRPGSADPDKSYWAASKRPDQQPHANMAADVEAFKRKSAIVRPWEIDEQSSKERLSPFQRTPGSSTNSISPRPVPHQPSSSNLSPFIHLPKDSKKYKDEIIRFAKQNSSSIETLSKFHFDEKSQMQAAIVANSTQFRGQRISSDQSLSPTFPLPISTPMKPFPMPSSITTTESTRTRSDSEETVSADEEDQKQHETQPPSIIIPQTPSKVATPPPTSSSLLMQRLRASASSESELEQLILKQAMQQCHSPLAMKHGHSPISKQPNPQVIPPPPPQAHSTLAFPPQSQAHHPQQYMEAQLNSPRDHAAPIRTHPIDELPLHGLPPEEALLIRESLRQKKLEEEKKLLYIHQKEERARREREEEMRRLIHLRKYGEPISYHLKQAEEEEIKRRQMQLLEHKQKEQHKLQLAQMEEDRLKQHLQHNPHPTSIEDEMKYRMMFTDRRQPYGNENMMRLIEEEHLKQIRLRQMEEEERNRHFRAIEEERLKQHHMSLQKQQGNINRPHLINTNNAVVEEEKRLRQKLDDEKKQQQLRLKQLEEQQLQLRHAETKKNEHEAQSPYHTTALQQPESMKNKRTSSPHPLEISMMRRTNSYPKQLSSPLQHPPQQEFLQQQVEDIVRLKPGSPLSVLATPEIPSSLKNISPNLDSQSLTKRNMILHESLPTPITTSTNQKSDKEQDANKGQRSKPRLKFHEHFPEKQPETKKENLSQSSIIQFGQKSHQMPPNVTEDSLNSSIQPPHVITQQLQDAINPQPEIPAVDVSRVRPEGKPIREKSTLNVMEPPPHEASKVDSVHYDIQQPRHDEKPLPQQQLVLQEKQLQVEQSLENSQEQPQYLKQLQQQFQAQQIENQQKSIEEVPEGPKQHQQQIPQEISATQQLKTPHESLSPGMKQRDRSHVENISEGKSARGVQEKISSVTDCSIPSKVPPSTVNDKEEAQTKDQNKNVIPEKVRAESPDIYDMNEPDEEYDAGKDKGLDLYENLKPRAIDMMEIPKSDVELFYSTPERDSEIENSENKEQTDNAKNSLVEAPHKHSNVTETKECDFGEKRSGTPVMDEQTPIQDLPSLQIPKGDQQGDNDGNSTCSTPEAHTPLMDEPNEFNFEPIHANTESMDFSRFSNQPNYSVPPSSALYLSSTATSSQLQQRPIKAQQEAFESITPPSSPEHEGNKRSSQQTPKQESNYFPATTTAPTSTANPIAAFPFSALAINVGSRPSSRSGSSNQSPNAAVSDHSPRSDLELNAKERLHQQQQQQKLLKRKRENSSDSGDHSKRSQKRSYRLSSQSSSASSISKSPEYDFSKSKRT